MRILSLDVFRGLTVALMIMVNNQSGGAFAALKHRAWDGCTPTDLVFPFFLFIVGASLWFSHRRSNHALTGATAARIIRRGALIFAVGLALNWISTLSWNPWADLRIMGVLQRIGVAFAVGGIVALWLKSYRKIGIVSAAILAGYWIVVMTLGDATKEGFVGNRIDAFILGARHLWQPAASFDPEGLFSTIPAVVTVLLGYMAGRLVGENQGDLSRVPGRLGVAGGGLIVAALALNTVCPINKAIWSPTFVLYTAGLAMMVWLALLWFYDLRGRCFGAVFGATFGTNALFIYVVAWIAVTIPAVGRAYWRMMEALSGLTTPAIGSLLASLVLVGALWLTAWPLYRRRIFIKL